MDTWSRSGSSSVEEFLETCGAAMLLSSRYFTHVFYKSERSFFFFLRSSRHGRLREKVTEKLLTERKKERKKERKRKKERERKVRREV